MEGSIDFSTYCWYNIISKAFIDSEGLDEVINDFDSKHVHVLRVDKDELVAGFTKHNLCTKDFILKSSYDYHFLVSPAPFNIMTYPTKNTPHGHYHWSCLATFLGDNKGDKKDKK